MNSHMERNSDESDYRNWNHVQFLHACAFIFWNDERFAIQQNVLDEDVQQSVVCCAVWSSKPVFKSAKRQINRFRIIIIRAHFCEKSVISNIHVFSLEISVCASVCATSHHWYLWIAVAIFIQIDNSTRINRNRSCVDWNEFINQTNGIARGSVKQT